VEEEDGGGPVNADGKEAPLLLGRLEPRPMQKAPKILGMRCEGYAHFADPDATYAVRATMVFLCLILQMECGCRLRWSRS
jgi:hypothetical protein